jgi:hypothetical protein
LSTLGQLRRLQSTLRPQSLSAPLGATYRALLAGDWHLAASQFRLWANPPLLGLRICRERARVLFTGGNWRTVRDNQEPWCSRC